MGFSTLATTVAATAAALPKALEAYAYRQEGKNLSRAANVQEKLSIDQSENMIATALRNMRAESRNANDSMAHAYADAGASNLAEDGSVSTREKDLASRLQDEINLHADAALQEANTTRKQGAYEAWNTRMQARRAKSMARSSLISGLSSFAGQMVGGLGKSLSGLGSSGGQV